MKPTDLKSNSEELITDLHIIRDLSKQTTHYLDANITNINVQALHNLLAQKNARYSYSN